MKPIIFATIRKRALSGGAECVIYIVDSYMLDIDLKSLTPERRQELDELSADGASLDELSLLGYGKRVECLTIISQFPDGKSHLLVQPYTRNKGAIAYGSCDDKGELETAGNIAVWSEVDYNSKKTETLIQ